VHTAPQYCGLWSEDYLAVGGEPRTARSHWSIGLPAASSASFSKRAGNALEVEGGKSGAHDVVEFNMTAVDLKLALIPVL